MPRSGGKKAQRAERAVIVALIGGMVLVTVAFIAMLGTLRSPGHDHPPAASVRGAVVSGPVARRETRPTLDPAAFTGKAALAYQVAREIPDVLDHMQCYCACGSQYGHVSLLSCYVDGHGST